MTNSARILLPGLVPNLRDVGELTTRDGGLLRSRRLLRTSALAQLSAPAVEALAGLVGPALYVDLRTDAEIAQDGAPTELIRQGWSWERLPLMDKLVSDTDATAGASLRRYRRHLSVYLATARRLVPLLGERTVVVGCTLGRDRTGLMVALLLRWLRVRRADIIEDFTLSNQCLQAGWHLLPPHWTSSAHARAPVHGWVCASVLETLDGLERGPGAVPTPRMPVEHLVRERG
ncbi:tyrosine-protein phosphatase [Streptomyces sp. NPDC001339]|uniref:tyrosine-protein phosphatase n=1 Tax=Streptomyces sp. NPDC001339 TaxID=3364563 RepID=UPI0036A486B1